MDKKDGGSGSSGNLKREDAPENSFLGMCESEQMRKILCDCQGHWRLDWKPEFNKNSQLIVSLFVTFSHMVSGVDAEWIS